MSWNIIEKKPSGNVGTRTCVAGIRSQQKCYALDHHTSPKWNNISYIIYYTSLSMFSHRAWPPQYRGSRWGLFCISTRDADAYRASAARKWDFCQPISVGFRAAPHKRRLFAARYQCVAISHKEECYVIELTHDDWNPYPINWCNSFATRRL